jgi:hypothetical protein
LAGEIKFHDWSDAPFRKDRAGHQRATDSRVRLGDQILTVQQTEAVLWNVCWVVGQVLGHADPNFDVYEFFEAAGVRTKTSAGRQDQGIVHGIRRHADGSFQSPNGTVPAADAFGAELEDDGPWGPVDFASEQPLDVATATALVNRWLEKRGDGKRFAQSAFAAYVQKAGIPGRQNPDDPIPLGALRKWYVGYYREHINTSRW